MTDRRVRIAVVASVAVALAVVVTWPWVIHPTDTLGSRLGEADNHVWGLWRVSQAARGHGGPWMNWPVGDPRPLVDLVHAPLATLLMPLNPSFSYGVQAFLDVVLAGLGGYWLSREAGAGPRAAVVGTVALATAPILGGQLVHGLSEDWSIGWLALYGAATLWTARTGRWVAAAVAAVCLASFAYSGWYFAAFAAMAAPVWLLWAWRLHRPDRRSWALILGAGAAAVVLVVPGVVHLLANTDLSTITERILVPSEAGQWLHAEDSRADVVGLVLPQIFDASLPRTVYLGLAALALAAVAAAKVPSARVPASAVVVFAIFAMGSHVSVAGVTVVPTAPAAWLAVVPVLRGIVSWYRVLAVVAVFLAPLAALGADRLVGQRGPWWVVLVAVVVGADGIVGSDAAWPRTVYPARAPVELELIPGRGPMLILPEDRGGTSWKPHVPRLYQQWQPTLGRPITQQYEGDAFALEGNPFVQWARETCTGPSDEQTPPRTMEEAKAGIGALREAGLHHVAVVRWRIRDQGRCIKRLRQLLGRPGGHGEQITWWGVGGP